MICRPYNIRTIFRSGTIRLQIPMLNQVNTTWLRIAYTLSCSCGEVNKGKTCHPLKVRLEEHWKAVCWGEIEKLIMADHIWKEKGNHLPLWDEVKIIDWGKVWRIRHLKEAAHMLGYSDLLSWPSIEMNTICGNQ